MGESQEPNFYRTLVLLDIFGDFFEAVVTTIN